MNTPVPIRRGDLLLAAGCGILQATALALGYGSLPRENYAALVCLGGVQGIALVLWRRHPVACQFLVWGAQLAVMVLMPRGNTFAGGGRRRLLDSASGSGCHPCGAGCWWGSWG